MKIRALIVDDEPHAREGIRIRLEKFADVEVVGECASGAEAVQAIGLQKPDLLFLDIQMPEKNGFEVLKEVGVASAPVVIFVTAYDRYALKAFECHALDYLLKPINDERFEETVRLALTRIGLRNLGEQAEKLKSVIDDYLDKPVDRGDELSSAENYLSRLVVKSRDHIMVIPVVEIDWLESGGDYVYIHSNSQKHIIRDTLVSLEKKLDPKQFVRIHRTAIVNIGKVKSLRSNDHGDFDVFLQNGERLRLSRMFRANFQRVIGNSL